MYNSRMARLARVLWIVWAVIVWNVVFDHVIAVAGRQYVHAAAVAAQAGASYARMDDWMRPAVERGLWTASAAAGAIVLSGWFGVRIASSRAARGRRRGAAGEV